MKAITSKYKVDGRDRPVKEVTQLFLSSQSGDFPQGQEQEDMDPLYSILCFVTFSINKLLYPICPKKINSRIYM